MKRSLRVGEWDRRKNRLETRDPSENLGLPLLPFPECQ